MFFFAAIAETSENPTKHLKLLWRAHRAPKIFLLAVGIIDQILAGSAPGNRYFGARCARHIIFKNFIEFSKVSAIAGKKIMSKYGVEQNIKLFWVATAEEAQNFESNPFFGLFSDILLRIVPKSSDLLFQKVYRILRSLSYYWKGL